jgi:hypothetical protein
MVLDWKFSIFFHSMTQDIKILWVLLLEIASWIVSHIVEWEIITSNYYLYTLFLQYTIRDDLHLPHTIQYIHLHEMMSTTPVKGATITMSLTVDTDHLLLPPLNQNILSTIFCLSKWFIDRIYTNVLNTSFAIILCAVMVFVYLYKIIRWADNWSCIRYLLGTFTLYSSRDIWITTGRVYLPAQLFVIFNVNFLISFGWILFSQYNLHVLYSKYLVMQIWFYLLQEESHHRIHVFTAVLVNQITLIFH